MHLNTNKIPIDFGLDKPSASISVSIVKAIFHIYLRCLCVTFSETVVVNSETIAAYRSNRSPLLTELTFFRKSSMNISIDIRYCNRVNLLGRQIFPVNHNGASPCSQSRPHLGSCIRVSVSRSRGTGHPIYDMSQIIATEHLDALTVPPSHYFSNNCVYFQSYLLAQHWLIRHFVLTDVIAGDSALTLEFHVLQKKCAYRYHYNLFPHLDVN